MVTFRYSSRCKKKSLACPAFRVTKTLGNIKVRLRVKSLNYQSFEHKCNVSLWYQRKRHAGTESTHRLPALEGLMDFITFRSEMS